MRRAAAPRPESSIFDGEHADEALLQVDRTPSQPQRSRHTEVTAGALDRHGHRRNPDRECAGAPSPKKRRSEKAGERTVIRPASIRLAGWTEAAGGLLGSPCARCWKSLPRGDDLGCLRRRFGEAVGLSASVPGRSARLQLCGRSPKSVMPRSIQWRLLGAPPAVSAVRPVAYSPRSNTTATSYRLVSRRMIAVGLFRTRRAQRGEAHRETKLGLGHRLRPARQPVVGAAEERRGKPPARVAAFSP